MQKQGRSTQRLLPFFDSIVAYFSRKHPYYTLYLGVFLGREVAHRICLKKADATTSYCIGFVNGEKRRPVICYKPLT